jgi:heme exporter protein D
MSPEGVVVGGWGYVWAAYGLTAAGLLIYGLSLVARMRELKRKLHDAE